MAKETTKQIEGIFVCKSCDFSSRERGYGTITKEKGKQAKCPQCNGTNLEKEDRHHRFLRLATKRARNVMSANHKLGVLANPNYKWEPVDIDKLFGALHDNLEATREQFEKAPAERKPEFIL